MKKYVELEVSLLDEKLDRIRVVHRYYKLVRWLGSSAGLSIPKALQSVKFRLLGVLK